MGEKLKNPPLIECVCEFRFTASSDWDWTIPGQLYDKIKADFPERSEVQATEALIPVSAEDGVSPVRTRTVLVRLKRPDGSAMVQVGRNLLAVNHLRPYPEWDSFLALILEVYEQYQSVAAPTGLERIGLRYINHIAVPSIDFDMSTVLSQANPLPWAQQYSFKNLYQRYELQLREPEGILVYQIGSADIEGRRGVILDLDFASTQVGDMKSVSSLKTWLNGAHDRVLDAFVQSVNRDRYEVMKRGES